MKEIGVHHEWLAEELTKYGQKVVNTRYDVVSLWGGSFRCSHHPLVRDSELD
jgi:N-dimethylarginine dimethylaminohydrolase